MNLALPKLSSKCLGGHSSNTYQAKQQHLDKAWGATIFQSHSSELPGVQSVSGTEVSKAPYSAAYRLRSRGTTTQENAESKL